MSNLKRLLGGNLGKPKLAPVAVEREPISIRKLYYKPALDPYVQRTKMTPAMRKVAEEGDYAGQEDANVPDVDHMANVCSSLCEDGMHRPALDIDIPCELVPSSTKNHYHLYFPTLTLSWEDYRELLLALAKAGVIEEGYLGASLQRKATFLRLPWVQK